MPHQTRFAKLILRISVIIGLIVLLSSVSIIGPVLQGAFITRDVSFESSESTVTLSGNLLINETYDYTGDQVAYRIIETSDGGFAFIGATEQENAHEDIWLVKVGVDGVIEWNRTWDSGAVDYGMDLVETDNGGFLLTAYVTNPTNYTDILLIQTDSLGHQVWNKTYSTPHAEYPDYLIKMSNGGFLLLGERSVAAPTGNRAFWFIRFDDDGNHIWNSTIGGPGSENAKMVIEHSSGSIIACGWYDQGGGDLDAWLVSIDSDGNQLWNQTYGMAVEDDAAYALVEASNGDIVFSGFMTHPTLGDQAWVVRTDSGGTQLWNKTHGGSGFERSDSMTYIDSQGFVLSCRTNSWGAGGVDVMILRLDENGNRMWNYTYGNAHNNFNQHIIQSSTGGFAVISYQYYSGLGSYAAWLILLPVPYWIAEPADQVVTVGETFSYNLEATSAAELSWIVNDTTFDISTSGTLTNATSLTESVHSLLITATDTVGNVLTGTLSVSVQAVSTTNTTNTTTVNGGLLDDITVPLLIVIGIVGVLLIVLLLRRRK